MVDGETYKEVVEKKIKHLLFPEPQFKDYIKETVKNIKATNDSWWNEEERSLYVRYLRTWKQELKEDILEKSMIKVRDYQGEKMTAFLKECFNSQKNPYSDITIQVENKTFKAHKIIIACFIPIILESVSKKKLRAPDTTVKVTGISSKTFEVVHKYIYTGTLDPRPDNITDVLELGFKLSIEGFCPLWVDLYEARLGSRTLQALFRCRVARKYKWTYLVQELNKVLALDLENLLLTEEFLTMKVTEIKDIISQDEIGVQNELMVFLTVLKWLNHDWSKRKEFAFTLFKEVRFPLMQLQELFACNNPPVLKEAVALDDVKALIADAVFFRHKTEGTINPQMPSGTKSRIYKSSSKESLRLWIPDAVTKPKAASVSKPHVQSDQKKPSEVKVDGDNKDDKPGATKSKIQSLPQTSASNVLPKSQSSASFLAANGTSKGFPDVDVSSEFPQLPGKPKVIFQREFLPEKVVITSIQEIPTATAQDNQPKSDLELNKDISYSPPPPPPPPPPPKEPEMKPEKQVAIPEAKEQIAVRKETVKVPKRELRTQTTSPPTPQQIESSKKLNLMAFGDNTTQASLIYVCPLNSETKQSFVWQTFGALPPNGDIPYDSVAVVCSKNIYFVGGINKCMKPRKEIKLEATSAFYRLDYFNKKLIPLRPMIEARVLHTVIGFKDKIYAIGGKTSPKTVTRNVEVYDIKIQQWQQLKVGMNIPRFGAACTTFGGLIWVLNGVTQKRDASYHLINDIIIYDPSKDLWMRLKYKLPMATAFSAVIEHNKELYVIGGRAVLRKQAFNTDRVWKLNMTAKSWDDVSKLPQPLRNIYCFSLGTKIYAIGGIDDKHKKTRLCYSLDTKDSATKWTVEQSLPTEAASNFIVATDDIPTALNYDK